VSEKFKSLFFFLCWLSGIPYLLRQFYQSKRATVLLFHDLDPQISGCVFRFLAGNYHLISGEELFQALATNRLHKLPARSMLITFDDGRRTNLELETHLLGIRPINFISTHELRLDGKRYVASVEIEQLAQLFDVQGHTHCHCDLTRVDDQRVKEEIALNKALLEEKLGKHLEYLAYPYGLYDQRALSEAKQAGYKAAFTGNPGFVHANDGVYQIKRICVPSKPSRFELSVRVSGMFFLIAKLVRKR